MSDNDSIPDLESISETDSKMSENSGLIFTRPDVLNVTSFIKGTCVTNEAKTNTRSFAYEEPIMMLVDDGEDKHSTFDTAMLANVEESVEGVQTELYNSGASCHMSPYCDHFKNYVRIMPKVIAAADKRYFQAIRKGDLCIKIPAEHEMTTVLLKDVLHCLVIA